MSVYGQLFFLGKDNSNLFVTRDYNNTNTGFLQQKFGFKYQGTTLKNIIGNVSSTFSISIIGKNGINHYTNLHSWQHLQQLEYQCKLVHFQQHNLAEKEWKYLPHSILGGNWLQTTRKPLSLTRLDEWKFLDRFGVKHMMQPPKIIAQRSSVATLQRHFLPTF